MLLAAGSSSARSARWLAAAVSASTSLMVLPDSRSSTLSWPLASRTLSAANFV